MKKYAIIVAGGSGLRLGGEIPKQFQSIKGRPVLFYTLEKFQGLVDEIILVLPSSHMDYWQQLCQKSGFVSNAVLISGGNSRSASVMNGLLAVKTPGLVAIHDAVRPFVSKKLIELLFDEAANHGNAIPVIPIRESMRQKKESQSRSVNREEYLAVQTPQCFDYQKLIDAYREAGTQVFTDDAGVFEFAGGTVHLVAGETTNIKITFSEDIAFAEALLDATKM